MADVKKTIQFDVYMDTEAANNAISKFSYKISTLNRVAHTVFKNLRNVSKSDVRVLGNELAKTEKEIEAFTVALKNSASSGVDYSSITKEINNIIARYNKLESQVNKSVGSADILGGLKDTSSIKNFQSNFKSALKSVNSIASSTFKHVFNGATTLSRAWLNTLNKTFKGVISTWGNMLKSVFSNNNASSSLGNMLNQALPLAGLAGLVALGKKAVEFSSSMVEVQNIVDNVFKGMSKSVDEFTSNISKTFGVTELQGKQMVGIYGSMLQASEILNDSSVEMSKNLVALSGDVASFYNMDVDTVFKKFQSGLSGEVEAMRSFGVSMTVANLEAYALSRGIDQSYESMNQATKTTLRYNYMLDMLSNAQGDFTRTSTSWANQVRILSSNFKQLLSVLGGGLIKVLYPTLKVLNEIVGYALTGANALAAMFGFKAVDLSSMFGSSGDVAGDYSSSLDDVAKSTDDVADATKKAASNLQGFDKINNITTDTGASKGVSGLGGLSAIDFDSYYDKILEKTEGDVNERLKKIVDTFKSFAKDIASVDYSVFRSEWNKLGNSVGVIADDLGNSIKWLWKEVLFPFYTWSATVGAPASMSLMSTGLKTLDKVIKAVSPEIDTFWNKSLEPYFSAKGDAFTITLQNWETGLFKWGTGLDNSSDKLEYLGNTIDTIKDKFYDWLDNDSLTKRISSISDQLNESFSKIFDIKFDKSGALTQILNKDTLKWAKDIASSFLLLSGIVFDNVLKLGNTLVGNKEVSDFIGFLAEQFGELADYTFDAIIEVINYIAGSQDARDIIVNIKEALKNIIDFIVENKETIISTLKTASDLIVVLSDHLGGVLTTLALFKGAYLVISTATTMTKLAELGTKLRGLSSSGGEISSIGTAFAGASAVAVGAIGGIIVALGVGVKGAIDSIKDVKADATNLAAYKAPDLDKAKTQLETPSMTFDTSSAVGYLGALNNINDAYKKLNDGTKELGQKGSEDGFLMFASSAKSDAESYAYALKQAGYANDELRGKIEALAATDISGMTNKQKEAYKLDVGSAIGAVQSELNAQGEVLRASTDTQMSLWSQRFTGYSATAANNLTTTFASNISTGTANIDGSISGLTNTVGNRLSSLQLFGSDAGNKVVTGTATSITNGLPTVANSVQALNSSVNNRLSSLKMTGNQAGINTVLGINQGVNNQGAQSSIFSSLSNLAKNMMSKFQNVLGIHSPSKEFAMASAWIPKGVAVGVDDGASVAYDSVTSFASGLLGTFQDETVDMSTIIDSSKFSTFLDSTYNQTDAFVGDMNSKLSKITMGDIDANGIQAQTVTKPTSVAQSIKAASDSNSNLALQSQLLNISSKVSTPNNSQSSKPVYVSVYLDENNKLSEYIVNTVNGEVVRNGNF